MLGIDTRWSAQSDVVLLQLYLLLSLVVDSRDFDAAQPVALSPRQYRQVTSCQCVPAASSADTRMLYASSSDVVHASSAAGPRLLSCAAH